MTTLVTARPVRYFDRCLQTVVNRCCGIGLWTSPNETPPVTSSSLALQARQAALVHHLPETPTGVYDSHTLAEGLHEPFGGDLGRDPHHRSQGREI